MPPPAPVPASDLPDCEDDAPVARSRLPVEQPNPNDAMPMPESEHGSFTRAVHVEPPALVGMVHRVNGAKVHVESRRERESAARTLPSSAEAEEHLLSCLMIDGEEVLAKCEAAGLKATAFAVRANQIIFETAVKCAHDGKPLDSAVLAEELKTARRLDEVGGFAYLVQISQRVPTTAQTSYFIKKICELHTLRELIRTATGVIEGCYSYEGDLPEMLAGVEQNLAKVMAAGQGRTAIADMTADPHFETYPKRRNPLNLLGGEGALQRGTSMEWVGMTGTGKSSSIMDAAMSWCRGVDFLGLISHGELKILVLQCEDGPDVISKIFVSYYAHHRLSEPEKNKIRKNIIVCTVKGVMGAEFLVIMEQKCKLHRPDLVIINPVGRYMDGDMSNGRDVNLFTTAIDRVNVRCGNQMGIICVAHTPKPSVKAEDRKQTKSTFEMAYNSSGSAQWANYYRNTIFLEPRKERGRFFFCLAKGADLWGIRREYVITADGKVTKVYEPVHRIAGKFCTETLEVEGEARPMIVWEPDTDEPGEGEKDPDEGSKGFLGSKMSGHYEADILFCFPSSQQEGKGLTEINRILSERLDVAEGAVRKWRVKLSDNGHITQDAKGWHRTAAGDQMAARSAAGKLEKEDDGI